MFVNSTSTISQNVYKQGDADYAICTLTLFYDANDNVIEVKRLNV